MLISFETHGGIERREEGGKIGQGVVNGGSSVPSGSSKNNMTTKTFSQTSKDPDLDQDPERGLKWIRIRVDPDPDPKRWLCLLPRAGH